MKTIIFDRESKIGKILQFFAETPVITTKRLRQKLPWSSYYSSIEALEKEDINVLNMPDLVEFEIIKHNGRRVQALKLNEQISVKIQGNFVIIHFEEKNAAG